MQGQAESKDRNVDGLVIVVVVVVRVAGFCGCGLFRASLWSSCCLARLFVCLLAADGDASCESYAHVLKDEKVRLKHKILK
jgi:hypothetical protein